MTSYSKRINAENHPLNQRIYSQIKPYFTYPFEQNHSKNENIWITNKTKKVTIKNNFNISGVIEITLLSSNVILSS